MRITGSRFGARAVAIEAIDNDQIDPNGIDLVPVFDSKLNRKLQLKIDDQHQFSDMVTRLGFFNDPKHAKNTIKLIGFYHVNGNIKTVENALVSYHDWRCQEGLSPEDSAYRTWKGLVFGGVE